MALTVPGTLKETLEPEVLTPLDEAIGPPAASRLPGRWEIEVEAAGEGTFTLVVDNGAVSGKKGFAKGDPFVSCEIPKGGWPFVRRLLQAAVDGFPAAPALKERQEQLRSLSRGEIEAAIKGIEKLDDLAVELAVGGVGSFRVGRGALDEVTRELKVSISADAFDRALSGAGVSAFAEAKISGDRGLTTEILAALGPLVAKLKR